MRISHLIFLFCCWAAGRCEHSEWKFFEIGMLKFPRSPGPYEFLNGSKGRHVELVEMEVYGNHAYIYIYI